MRRSWSPRPFLPVVGTPYGPVSTVLPATRRWRTRSLITGLLVTGSLTVSALVTSLLATDPAWANGAAVRPPSAGPVVLIGAPGLDWTDDSSATGTLQNLSESASAAALSVRGVHESSCPIDGWLTLSSGRRAADDAPGVAVCRLPEATIAAEGGPATVPQWAHYVALARTGTFDAQPGLLGDTLAASGVKSAAVGAGAAIALATSAGSAPNAWSGSTPSASGAIDATADPTLLVNGLTAALKSGAQVIVVDVGAIRNRAVGATTEPSRAVQVAAVDSRISVVLGALPDNATVIVAGLGDSGANPHLGLLAAIGPAGWAGARTSVFGDSQLRTASTRQNGIVQLTDLFPSVLFAAGVTTPATAVGAPIQPVAGGGDAIDRLSRLVGFDLAAMTVRRAIGPFWLLWGAAQLIAYLLAGLLLRGGFLPKRTAGRVRGAVGLLALAAGCIPAATYPAALVPWWLAPHPTAVLFLIIVSIAAGWAVVAAIGPWRTHRLGPWGAVGVITAMTLIADVLTGSTLQINTIIGENPLVAGRFYGFGNAAFGLLATGALMAAGAGAQVFLDRGSPKRAVLLVVTIGLLALIMDGAPGLGSDFGGPPALIPAFAYLAFRSGGRRITWARTGAVAGVTMAAITALSLADWLRPASDRTHLGRFVQEVIDGQAGTVVARKAAQNVQFAGQPVALLLPIAAILVLWALVRPESVRLHAVALAYRRSPLLPSTLVSIAIVWSIGLLVNDSGVSIPAAGATLLLPPLIHVALAARREQDNEDLAAAIKATQRAAKPKRK